MHELNEELQKRIKAYSIYRGISFEDAIEGLLKEGLDRLYPIPCHICKELFEKEVLKYCRHCQSYVHCGYTYLEYHLVWKGETTRVDPDIQCFICYLNYGIDADEIQDLKDYPQNLKDYIEYEIDHVGGESGEGITTEAVKDYSETIEPETWKYTDEHAKKRLTPVDETNKKQELDDTESKEKLSQFFPESN